MSTRTVRANFRFGGVLTDATSATLSDSTAAYGVKRDDTDAVVVAAGTAFTKLATGQYSHTFTEPAAGLAYTAWAKFVYAGDTYYEEIDLAALPIPTTGVDCNYSSLVNDVGFKSFGLRPTASNVITDGVATTNQAADILRAIAKGLQFVYSAHRWGFLRPVVTVTTHPAYSTGTITVDASGNVTGDGTTFPTYSASAGGWLSIPSVGSFAVSAYSSATAISLADYTGAAITSPSPFSLGFNTYPMPSGVQSLEGRLAYPEGASWPATPLDSVPWIEIQRRLARDTNPGKPAAYAEIMATFDATVGSQRQIMLYPIPDAEYTLKAIGVLTPGMVSETNQYPIGAETLAPVIQEACLAAAEREIEGKDELHPEAVHSRAVKPLLAMAIDRDQADSTPDTLGVDHGQGRDDDQATRRSGRIYWNAGCDFTGYL